MIYTRGSSEINTMFLARFWCDDNIIFRVLLLILASITQSL